MKYKLFFIFFLSLLLSACASFFPIIPVETATAVANNQTGSVATSTPQPGLILSPTATATPTILTCWSEGGALEEIFMSSEILPQRMEFFIYLPPCYDVFPDKRYPVIYLIHGQSFRQDQWERLGVDELADEHIASGEYPPFIVVMPRDWIWTQPSEDPFDEALIEELIPYIDAAYRTIPTREYRAVGGLSRGASWAVHLGLVHWELFGAIGAHSPPVFWEDTPFIDDWFAEIPEGQMPRIYVDIGDRDRTEVEESTFWFLEQLNSLDIPHEWHYFVGYHDEAYWAAHLDDYLMFYTETWK